MMFLNGRKITNISSELLNTGYSELDMVTIDDAYPEALEVVINVTKNELIKRQMKHVSITLEEDDSLINLMNPLGFNRRSQSIFIAKN